jgi:homoserine kinase type II
MTRALGFVPIPLADRESRTWAPLANRVAQLEPWLPGQSVPSAKLTQAQRHAAFRALASFHQCLAATCRHAPPPGLSRRRLEIQGLRDHDLQGLVEHLKALEDSPEQALGIEWARQARPLLARVLQDLDHAVERRVPCQACLRDCRGDHFLFFGDDVTGLVDQGAMDIDSPAADLARLLQDWDLHDPGSRAAALDAYESVRPLDLETVRLIAVYESTAALLTPAHWIRWHFLERRRFDDRSAPLRALRQALDRFRGVFSR